LARTRAPRAARHRVDSRHNDKDLLALANAHVRIYSTAKADLASPDEPVRAARRGGGREEMGCAAGPNSRGARFDWGQRGHIPGVPGVGPKTAAALVLEHGTIQEMLAQPERIKNEKLRAKIIAAADQIRQNREMVRLDDDLPLPKPIESLTVEPDYRRSLPNLEHAEFAVLTRNPRRSGTRW